MFELLGKTRIDFIGKRYYAFLFSGLMIVLGLISLFSISMGKANLGIDFAGGTAVQLKFEHPVKIEDARVILEKNDLKEAELQEFSEGNKLLIRIKKQTTIQEKIAEKVVSIFTKELPDNHFVIDSSEEIGPTIGQKLQKDATLAVGIAMLGIIIYIAFRFEFRFGVAAAIATFHDVLAVLGIFYLLHREINLLIVTALLTLAGYSLTDTVVVFDRIRENLRLRSRETLEQVINNGINQVLSRTIVVSLTVFLVLLALFFFGGEVIHDFSFALLMGVVIGTYSSIFVASPILVVWKGSKGKLLRRMA
ncbi:MAG: protein translocase subunit SecF [Nitrospirae bacterium]|nr:protein translocase subunit SecF [Nitrospirota bacterium]MBI3595252.1 protein translocase subunit SecF [Nitrospirota bacterium]